MSNLWWLADAFAFDQLERDRRTGWRDLVEDRLIHHFRSDHSDLLEILQDRRDRRSETFIEIEWFQSHQGNIFRNAESGLFERMTDSCGELFTGAETGIRFLFQYLPDRVSKCCDNIGKWIIPGTPLVWYWT